MISEKPGNMSIECDGCAAAGIWGTSWGNCCYIMDRCGWWTIAGPGGQQLHYCADCFVQLAQAVAGIPEVGEKLRKAAGIAISTSSAHQEAEYRRRGGSPQGPARRRLLKAGLGQEAGSPREGAPRFVG